jgi:hypothetical protein
MEEAGSGASHRLLTLDALRFVWSQVTWVVNVHADTADVQRHTYMPHAAQGDWTCSADGLHFAVFATLHDRSGARLALRNTSLDGLAVAYRISGGPLTADHQSTQND